MCKHDSGSDLSYTSWVLCFNCDLIELSDYMESDNSLLAGAGWIMQRKCLQSPFAI